MNELQLYSELAPLATKSKVEITELAQKQIDYIKENGDAENTFAFLKKCSTLLDLVTDGVKEDAMTAIGRGSDYFHGVKMTIESRTTYNYLNNPSLIVKVYQYLTLSNKPRYPFSTWFVCYSCFSHKAKLISFVILYKTIKYYLRFQSLI